MAFLNPLMKGLGGPHAADHAAVSSWLVCVGLGGGGAAGIRQGGGEAGIRQRGGGGCAHQHAGVLAGWVEARPGEVCGEG